MNVWDGIVELARREGANAEDVESLQPETRLVEDLELDSIRRLSLAVAVEDRFRICLDPEDEMEIVTLGDLASVVERKLAEGSDGA